MPARQTRSLGKASAGKLALLYDGSCEMCTAGVEQAARFDNSGAIEPLDLHDATVHARFPDLEPEALLEELHAVDDTGRIYRGALAIREILRRQRGVRSWLAWLWYIPGYGSLADRQYKRMAASRYQRDGAGRLKGEAAVAQR